MSIGSQPGGSGSEAGGNQPRPYWLVGAVLFGVVVVVLVGALALDRTLRPPVGTEPVPGSGVQTDSAVIQDRTAVLPPANGIPSASAPTGDPGATPQTAEQEVEQAYLRYWDVYAAALLDLDDTRLGEVSTGDELRRMGEEVANSRRGGYAVRVDVSHSYVIVDVTVDEARLVDEIFDRSFTVDPVTKNPPQGSNAGNAIRDLFTFKRVDGVWKVANSIRETG